MTTYTNFTPSPTQNFSFNPTLDGNAYTAIVTWNVFGQRYYLNIYTTQGALIICTAIVGSPDDYSINLAAGLFTSSLLFRESSGQFEVSP